MFLKRATLAFLFSLSVFLFGVSGIQAQGIGIKIIPATLEKAAEPGEILHETIVVSNIGTEDKTYFLYKKDIKGVEGAGVPVFAEEGTERTGFELSEWITFDGAEEIFIPAGEQRDLEVVITIPENASPGSHFGGIFVSAEPPKLREIGAGVGYEVASIVSIRIAGDVVDNARIRSFSTDKLFYSTKNIDFLIKVENQGNILIRPRGPLTITNMFDKTSANIIVNDSLAGVFPGAVRDIEVPWTEEGFGFGRYEAVVALVYDGNGGQKTIDAAVTFWILPLKLIIPILIALFVVFGSGYIFARMYINRAVALSGGSRRIISKRQRQRVGISRVAFIFVTLLSVVTLFLLTLLLLFA